MTRKKVGEKKQKLEVVFDPQKRREFLSGFQKRKTERRKRAQDQFEKNLKEERKRIKQEIKDGFKHMKKSFEPLRELTEEDRKEEEYEDDDVKIRIVELSNTSELAAHNTMLGQNQEESESEVENETELKKSNKTEESELPGMDLKPTKKQKKALSANVKVTESEKSDGKLENISSKRDLNRLVKQKTMKKLQKSKVFKQKERLDKRANEKKVHRTRKTTLKALPQYARKKIKNEPSRYNKGRMMSRKQFQKKKQNMQ